MGTFFVNFHAKTKAAKAVATTLRKLINTRAYVTSARGGWVSAYEERTSSQDTDEIIRLARELSLHLDKPVIALLCHDSDVFCYWLFDGGQLCDEYDSWPDYFKPVGNEVREKRLGKPEVLLRYCKRGTNVEQVKSVLSQGREHYRVADQRAADLAKLLGVDSIRSGVDVRDFDRGDITPEEVGAKLLSGPGAEEYGESHEEREMRLATEHFRRECIKRMRELRGKDSQDALTYAIAANLPDEIRAILAEGADVNGKNPHGGTALSIAIQYRHLDTLRFLIQLGADVNQPAHGRPLLCWAMFHNDMVILNKLLEAGADPNGDSSSGSRPLMDAVKLCVSPAFVQRLLAAGADVHAPNEDGETALAAAQTIVEGTRGDRKQTFHVVFGEDRRSQAQLHADASEIVELLRQAGAVR